MNILVIGLPFFESAFRSHGHQALNGNYYPDSDLLLKHPHTWKSIDKKLQDKGFSVDFVLYVDNGNLPHLIDPHNIPVPSIYYSIDTYCNPWHVPYAHSFDMVLAAQKDFLPLFLKDGQNGKWMPLFCKASLCDIPSSQRDIPVSFVGTLGHKNNPQREPFLKAFNAYQPLSMLSGDYVPVFSSSRIVLNQTAFGELNFRCFEAMGLGAALLMEKCGNGLEDLFVPGENILPPYVKNDAKEAAKIASIYLKRPAALESIAKNGREIIRNKHTEVVRAGQILELAEQLLTDKIHVQRLARPYMHKLSTANAFGMLASEMTDEKWQPYRKLFFRIAQNNYEEL